MEVFDFVFVFDMKKATVLIRCLLYFDQFLNT